MARIFASGKPFGRWKNSPRLVTASQWAHRSVRLSTGDNLTTIEEEEEPSLRRLFLLILLQFQCTGTAHYLDQSQWPTVVGLSKPCIQHATTLSRCQLPAGESWGRRSARGDRGVRTGSARSSVCGRNNPCGERAASRRDASECRSGSVTTLSRSQLLIGKTCVTVKSEPFRKDRDQSVGQKGSSGRLDQGALRPEAAWR